MLAWLGSLILSYVGHLGINKEEKRKELEVQDLRSADSRPLISSWKWKDSKDRKEMEVTM